MSARQIITAVLLSVNCRFIVTALIPAILSADKCCCTMAENVGRDVTDMKAIILVKDDRS
jgi:hypothetical protein